MEELPSYSIFSSSLHGFGVKSNSFVPEGSTIFSEKPLYFLQTIENRSNVLVCGCCACFLGSYESSLQLLERKFSRQTVTSGLCGQCPLPDCCGNDSFCPCDNFCGELYCSNACKEAHWLRSHYLLCTGNVAEEEAPTHPLIQFKTHAVSTNEIFLLVADVFAHIISAVDGIESGSPISIESAMTPLESYVRNYWWDVAILPDKKTGMLSAKKMADKKKKFQETLRNLVRESWELLSAAFHLTERGLDQILNADYMARTIGMFECNNVGVISLSLCGSLASKLAALPSANEELASRFLASAKIISNELQDEWEDDDDSSSTECESDHEIVEPQFPEAQAAGATVFAIEYSESDSSADLSLQAIIDRDGLDRLFPPLDGTAFYSLICRINHSCDPNVIVKYDVGETILDRKPLQGKLYALKDIQPGEELVQSYIDQSLDYSERQKALQDYGFVCSCQKCCLDRDSARDI